MTIDRYAGMASDRSSHKNTSKENHNEKMPQAEAIPTRRNLKSKSALELRMRQKPKQRDTHSFEKKKRKRIKNRRHKHNPPKKQPYPTQQAWALQDPGTAPDDRAHGLV